jgi:signal transduction histidine kinase
MNDVDIWTLWWAIATALFLVLTWNASAMLGRRLGRRAAGLGVALVPVTGVWLWALGVVGWSYYGLNTPFGGFDRGESFWRGLLIVAAVGVVAVILPRAAVCLASVGLLAFGAYSAYLALIVRVWGNTVEWWNWFLYVANRPVVMLVALASLGGGYAMCGHTFPRYLGRRSTELTARIADLTQTRAEVVDSAAAELRRLERDLHDGAQARLVALGINLRAAEKLVHSSPDAAGALIAECRETSAKALEELRGLVRGIYPPVLADRGLADAVQALSLDCVLPVKTVIDLRGRPPVPVESAVYFAVAEILNNAVKHADATYAEVRINHEATAEVYRAITESGWSLGEVFGFAGPDRSGMLRVEITDDGVGGANPGGGTGLLGIERRLQAFDGIIAVHSPAGGPTIVVIEVPCALSWPKISIS